MSFDFDPMRTSTRQRLTMTHKTLRAMWVVKDSLVEFPAVPKLEEPPIDPKDNP
jgi:hypothetical protein